MKERVQPDMLLKRAADLLAAARAAKTLVGYVVVGFRAGYPEVSANNQSFSAIRQSGRFVSDTPGTAIHHHVAPQEDEFVVTKHRVGAFSGTDLEMILRANRIDTLVLAGIATSGVVLSTVCHAADADYNIIVASDCCADHDPEVHQCLMEKVFPRQARVMSGEEIIMALAA